MSIVTAEDESIRALSEVFAAIDGGRHFILEAGAGAGKTYSLIKALEYVLGGGPKGSPTKSSHIACVTYTNVARDEIRRRIDNNPSVFCDTIHGFAWDLIRPFQSHIRRILASNARWQERQARRSTVVESQEVRYSFGFWHITDTEVFLGHDDVIWLMSELLSVDKFRRVLHSRYKYVFIDEYQDANFALMDGVDQDENICSHWQ
jgi:DNA helicase-2/ATP-dependent DNA helicase PcrA